MAEQLGYFSQAKLNVKLVPIDSWSDSLRAYQAGQLDGFTNTLVETVQSQLQEAPPLKVLLLADYSNGADVIIARQAIAKMEDLKGKKVGCEVTGLGVVVLAKALAKHGMSITDVTLVNHEQLSGEAALRNGDIDAFVSYPPASVNLMGQAEFHSVFDSREIPGGILDVLVVSAQLLKSQPDFAAKMRAVWQRAYDYVQAHPDDAFARMAKQENISAKEFAASYQNDIHVYSTPEMQQRLKTPGWLDEEAKSICTLLNNVAQSQHRCDKLYSIYP